MMQQDTLVDHLFGQMLRQADLGHTVMERCGHRLEGWSPASCRGEIAQMWCLDCAKYATINIVNLKGTKLVLILILPDGDCTGRGDRPITTTPCRWIPSPGTQPYPNDAPDGLSQAELDRGENPFDNPLLKGEHP